jgi:hypothetical protein
MNSLDIEQGCTMIRTAFFTISFCLLTACNSGSNEQTRLPTSETLSQKVDDDTNIIALTQTLSEYQTENPQATPLSCDTDNPHNLSLAIKNLNNLSQQIFALTTTSSINSYANFLAISQLALISKEHTAALVEQLGLAQVTQNNDWFNTFCQLEQLTPTVTTQVSIANDWQVNKSLLTQLNQYFPVNFIEKKIDPTSNLWRLSIANDWLAEIQLAVIEQDYIYYQATDTTEPKIAKAIMVTGNINTASNEIGKYIRISDDDSNIVINIIMPTFEQYDVVKTNLIDTLDTFKQLEQNNLEQLPIPYFTQNIASDDFVDSNDWINYNNINDILSDEGQNFSGINSTENFKLSSYSNEDYFIFDDTGKIKAQSFPTFSYEAISYQEAAFQNSVFFSSISITSISTTSILTNLCNEELFAQTLWRPYFILLENASNGLIYTMTKSMTPVIENQSNLCIETETGAISITDNLVD